MRHGLVPPCVLSLLLLSVLPLRAQTAQRSAIEGAVTDAGAAVIVGASVTLSGERLIGGRQAVETDERGRYRFRGLLPGVYHVGVASPGMQAATRGGIRLPVETTYVVDFVLTVAGVREAVDVSARAALMDVRSAASPTVLDAPVLYDVPTARTLQAVLGLAPGVTTTTPLYGYVGQVAFGGTQGSNGFTVDGVNLTEPETGGQNSQINYNWLEQVQVVALGAPAEYGYTTGAIANGVLRSGSNRVSALGELLTIRPSWSGSNLRHFPDDVPEPLPPRTILSWWDVNGQVGLPLVRDRLWLFTGSNRFRHEYRAWGFDGPGRTDEQTSRTIAKVDAAPARNVLLQGFVTRDATDVIGARVSRSNPTPESSPDQFTRTSAWNARGSLVLSPTTVLELRANGHAATGRTEPHPPATREGPARRDDWLAGVACCNSWFGRDERSAVLGGAALVHHYDGRLGRHELKTAVEYERTPVDSASGIPTGRRYAMLGDEVFWIEYWTGDHARYTARRGAFFVQDRWPVSDRVTLEAGLRVELNRGAVAGVARTFSTTPVAPRIGAAWDVTGRRGSVLRAHYGRYHDPLYGNVYTYTQPGARTPHVFYAPRDGELVELFRYVEQFNLAAPTTFKQSHVDQWVTGIEQAVGRHATVQLQYVGRRFGNFIGWIDLRLDDWLRYEVQDPGIDGIPGTADDGGSFVTYRVYGGGGDVSDRALVLGNPAGAFRRYDALQVIGTRRFADTWQAQVSYTWSRANGTAGNEYSSNAVAWSMNPGGFGANPGARDAGAGPPRYDYSEFKALGSYRAPWFGGFTVGGVFRWHTGTRWHRVARVQTPINTDFRAEPLNSRRTPSLGSLDLRVEKTLRLPGGSVMGVYVDAFNATNLGRATAYDAMSGPDFHKVGGWTDPRAMRLGVRVHF
jgi:hypothetical protein